MKMVLIHFNEIALDHNPPTVTINPAQANEGTDVTFICTADTSGTATYIWKKGGVTLENRQSFTKTNIKESDSGTYICETTVDSFGMQQADALLTVICKLRALVTIFLLKFTRTL